MAAAYRTHVSIIADVLQIARQCSYETSDGGATVTYLIRHANVPYQRLSSIVSLLKSMPGWQLFLLWGVEAWQAPQMQPQLG